MLARSFALRTVFLTVLAAGLLALGPSARADAPAGYYATVDLSSQAALRVSLHEVIDDHQRFPYTSSSTDTWNILEAADEDPNNSSNILDLYRNVSYTKFGGGTGPYNREHSWPNSYGFPDDGSSNSAYTDCHHLFLCDVGYNGDRGNKLFGNCSASCVERPTAYNNGTGGGSGTYPGNSNWYSTDWQTWQGRKGDVARAQLYMDVRYEGGVHSVTGYWEPDLILTDNRALIAASATGNNETVAYMGLLSVLLQWHAEDPVDALEMAHNDGVYAYQGNRNPFVDHPEWVQLIFGEFYESAAPTPAAPAALRSIRPNPFNPRTTVEYTVAADGPVRLEVFSVDGRRVAVLADRFHQAGDFRVDWDGRDQAGRSVPGAVYFCRLQAGGVSETQKVLLLK